MRQPARQRRAAHLSLVPTYPTVTGTRLVVSFPKMSITFTATMYRPALGYVCGALCSSSSRFRRVRKLCHSFSKM